MSARNSTSRVQYKSMLSAIARHNAKFARRGRLAPEAQAALAAANREVGSLIPETAEPDVPLSDAA